MGRCEGLVGWSTPSNTSPPGCNLQQTLYSCSFYRHTCTILKPNQKHAHAFFLFIFNAASSRRKLHTAMGVLTSSRVLERYRALHTFYGSNKLFFGQEAEWIGERVRTIDRIP